MSNVNDSPMVCEDKPIILVRNRRPAGYIAMPANVSRVARFAASEVARYMHRVSGAQIDVRQLPRELLDRNELPHDCIIAMELVSSGERTVESTDTVDDSYQLIARNGKVRLRASSERGLLYASYELLERIGCQWVLPSAMHEYIPQSADVIIPSLSITRKPSYELRTFIEDPKHVIWGDQRWLELHIEDSTAFVDWMGKQRINRFMPHRVVPLVALERILPMMSERGIEREIGGHIIPELLPRELFDTDPDLFRMNEKGERVPDGNLCPSNERALNIVAQNALEMALQSHSPFLHVWGADLVAGGWCHCSRCNAYTPQQQYLRVCEAIARAIREARLTTDVDYIAYHDTLQPDFGRTVNEPLYFLYAPRERCYAHPLDESDCIINQHYYDALKALQEAFNGRGYIFEYYGDALLFGSLMVPLSNVIVRDLRAYHRMGVRSIMCLTFGSFSWWAYGINLYAFARLAWDVDANWDAVEFFTALYQRWGGAVADIYAVVEDAMLPIVEEHDPMRGTIRDATHAEHRLNVIKRALRKLRDASRDAKQLLTEMMRSGDEELSMRWRADVELLRLTRLQLLLLMAMVRARRAKLGERPPIELLSCASADMHAQYRHWRKRALQLLNGFEEALRDDSSPVPLLLRGTWGALGAVNYQRRVVRRV